MISGSTCHEHLAGHTVATIFCEQVQELNEELEVLNAEARELEERISENVGKLLEDVP